MHVVAQDPETLAAAQRKATAFERDLAEAEPRLQDVNDTTDKVVAEGHPAADELDAKRKDLNARFANLKEKVRAAPRCTHVGTALTAAALCADRGCGRSRRCRRRSARRCSRVPTT